MTKFKVLKLNGEENGEIKLVDKIFNIEAKPALLNQAIVVQINNSRSSIAHTKDRSEVSGGGKKPWKQKGTGNARAGSSRSPLWVGGGVTFGPRNVINWRKNLSKKMRDKSIFAALSEKVKNKNVVIVNNLSFKNIKTSFAVEFLENMPIKEGSILVVLPKKDKNVELSFRNLPYVKTTQANNLNLYDIVKFDWIIFDEDSIKEIEKIYLKNEVNEKEETTVKPEKSEKTAQAIKKDNITSEKAKTKKK